MTLLRLLLQCEDDDDERTAAREDVVYRVWVWGRAPRAARGCAVQQLYILLFSVYVRALPLYYVSSDGGGGGDDWMNADEGGCGCVL